MGKGCLRVSQIDSTEGREEGASIRKAKMVFKSVERYVSKEIATMFELELKKVEEMVGCEREFSIFRVSHETRPDPML